MNKIKEIKPILLAVAVYGISGLSLILVYSSCTTTTTTPFGV